MSNVQCRMFNFLFTPSYSLLSDKKSVVIPSVSALVLTPCPPLPLAALGAGSAGEGGRILSHRSPSPHGGEGARG